MKLQHLIVIFIVMIVPITFIMSVYLDSQVKTITLQSDYNMKLMNATYDAIKAFQLNTVNNRYSSVSDSKIRDIEAEINTFYDSLSSSININADTLRSYTPVIVNTLYDGYYVYGRYANTRNANEYEYGLQPYIYYSCRYKKDNTDCVINYTLDNAITIYGMVNGIYVTKTGFLINPSNIDSNTINLINTGREDEIKNIKYKGLDIGLENLSETLIIKQRDNTTGNITTMKGTYPYTFYNNRKVYWDKDQYQYFWYENFEKTPVSANNIDTINYAVSTINGNRSAINYYIEAYKFSKWVQDNLGSITEQNAIDENGNTIEFETNNTYEVDPDSNIRKYQKIFEFNSTTNDPEKSSSVFETHRRAIMRNRLETSLIAALANFNAESTSGYEYVLPKLTEEDWEKIYTEVCITTYMQGLPIGTKMYNNYCVISNNQNKEFISEGSIVILTKETVDGIDKYTYHKPNCKHLIEEAEDNDNIKIMGAYTNLQIARQKVNVSNGNTVYFMPQQVDDKTPYLYCYECIVNVGGLYDLDEFIDGEITILNEYGEPTSNTIKEEKFKKVREKYFTTMAREKYNLYESISLMNGS